MRQILGSSYSLTLFGSCSLQSFSGYHGLWSSARVGIIINLEILIWKVSCGTLMSLMERMWRRQGWTYLRPLRTHIDENKVEELGVFVSVQGTGRFLCHCGHLVPCGYQDHSGNISSCPSYSFASFLTSEDSVSS